MAHKYYLLNIRLPVNERKKINVGIGEIEDMHLIVSFAMVPFIADTQSASFSWIVRERFDLLTRYGHYSQLK